MVNDTRYLDLKFGSPRSLHSSPSTTSSVLQSGSLKKMAGRPLLLEKPLAIDFTQAKRIVDLFADARIPQRRREVPSPFR